MLDYRTDRRDSGLVDKIERTCFYVVATKPLASTWLALHDQSGVNDFGVAHVSSAALALVLLACAVQIRGLAVGRRRVLYSRVAWVYLLLAAAFSRVQIIKHLGADFPVELALVAVLPLAVAGYVRVGAKHGGVILGAALGLLAAAAVVGGAILVPEEMRSGLLANSVYLLLAISAVLSTQALR